VPLEHNVSNTSVYVPHGNNTNNTSFPSDLEPSVISYQANQPADLQLWDGNFSPVSLFGIDEFLTGDAKNIVCSL